MEDFPEELRTPPISLVSVVGVPELHPTISSFLHSEQPPINTLALPDFAKATIMAAKQKDAVAADSGPPHGIVKRDWIAKHRTRVPAVVAAMFSYEHVFGDPAQWLQVCTDLENLKAVIRRRNIKLIVVLVQSNHSDDVNEDRMIALRKRAEIDSKYLILFDQNDTTELRQSLNRLASIFAELSNAYYREEGRRIRNRVEKKNFSFPELHARYCLKVAVYAEFRRDWAEALRFYEEGYNVLREMIGKSIRLPPIQRLVEIKSVAEQLHFKVSTLLLHGGKVVEAIAWFWRHISSYKKLTGPDEAVFLHWEWVSRQFLVFAELLETSSAAIPSTASTSTERQLTEWESRPAFFYQFAASYLRKKKQYLDLALAASATSGDTKLNADDSNSDSVVPSVFVGQFACLLEQDEALIMQPITDKEYMVYALSEGKRFQDSYEIIALLKKSYESYNILKAHRIAADCSSQMAREYFLAGDVNNAKELFDSITSIYRKEGWLTLLWEILGYLRECSRNLGFARDFVEYSLEMSALPIVPGFGVEPFDCKGDYGPAGPPSLQQRENIQNDVFAFIKGDYQLASTGENSLLNITNDQPLHLEIDPVSPLRAAFFVSVAFHDQTVKPGSSTLATLSLLSQLPLPLDIDHLEVQFNQSTSNFFISKVPGSDQEHRVVTVPNLTLVTNKWMRLTCEIIAGQSGKLECLSVTAKVGRHFSICYRAESSASMEDLPLWKFEDRVESFPLKDPCLSFFGQKVIQVEDPEPQVDLSLWSSGPALVGEDFGVTVTITSKGHQVHSGELKINLVDTRGGGLVSPREDEPFSSDSLHVELLRVAGLNEDPNSQPDTDHFEKIQQSFGLLSVPFLDNGETWSCKLEIKWHRPKLVMLYVSLGYLLDKETAAQKVNVHKSLQIEGKTPLLISHKIFMPFRQEALLLSKLKPSIDSKRLEILALGETSTLIIGAQNCTEVPLRLMSISLEVEDLQWFVRPVGEISTDPSLLVPGEEYKRVYSIIPQSATARLEIGTMCLKWTRDQLGDGASNSEVRTKYKIPDVNVERPPLIVRLECPPHAILGIPFLFCVKIQNQTNVLQEITYSLTDSQSFVLSGPHNGNADILPNSEAVLSYKLVPLSSGQQHLPRVTVISERYSARLQPSLAASIVFVFPSQPHFETSGGEVRGLEVRKFGQCCSSVQS